MRRSTVLTALVAGRPLWVQRCRWKGAPGGPSSCRLRMLSQLSQGLCCKRSFSHSCLHSIAEVGRNNFSTRIGVWSGQQYMGISPSCLTNAIGHSVLRVSSTIYDASDGVLGSMGYTIWYRPSGVTDEFTQVRPTYSGRLRSSELWRGYKCTRYLKMYLTLRFV